MTVEHLSPGVTAVNMHGDPGQQDHWEVWGGCRRWGWDQGGERAILTGPLGFFHHRREAV